jgi:hypothetical protein
LSTILGSGNYRYKVIENWAQLPDQWSFMDVAGVAVNSKDEVSYTNWPYGFGKKPKPKFLKILQKLEKIIN